MKLSPLLILLVCIKALGFNSLDSLESAGFSREAETPPPWVGMLRGSKVANPSLYNRFKHALAYRDAGFCNVALITAKHALVPAHCLDVPAFNQCLKVRFKKGNQPVSVNVTRFIMAPREAGRVIRRFRLADDIAILELEHSVDLPVPALDLYKHTKSWAPPGWHRMFSSRHITLFMSGYGKYHTFANKVMHNWRYGDKHFSYRSASLSDTSFEATGAPLVIVENEKAVVFGLQGNIFNFAPGKLQYGGMVPLYKYRDFIKKYIGPELDRSGFALGYEEIDPTDSLINTIFSSGSGSGIMDEVVLPYPEDWTTVQCHPSTEDSSSVIPIPYYAGWDAVNCRPPKEEIPSDTPTAKIHLVHEATIKAQETDAQPVRYSAQIDEHYSSSASNSNTGHSTYLMGIMMIVLSELIISQGY